MKSIVFQRQPRISVLESNRSLEAMDQQDFDLTYSGDQRVIDEMSDREYKEYVFQDSRPISPRGKDFSDDQIEKLIDADASIVNDTRQFMHYPDIDNTIGHARVSVIDNPKDPSLDATVIEEIQPDLVQAGVPRKEFEGKSLLDRESKEYATPGKVKAIFDTIEKVQQLIPNYKTVEAMQKTLVSQRDSLLDEIGVMEKNQIKDDAEFELFQSKRDEVDDLNNAISLIQESIEEASMKLVKDGVITNSEAGLAIGLDPLNLVKQPPFKTTTSASRYFMQNVIQKSLDDGVNTIILPDYEDLARVHGSDSVKSFKQNYTDVFNKIISDYKNQGIKVETGVIKPDELDEIQFGENLYDDLGAPAVKPMKYVTFPEPEQIKKAAIRRYNKGGQVNVRSGIGAMARTHM